MDQLDPFSTAEHTFALRSPSNYAYISPNLSKEALHQRI
jgi:hypothetical protein